MTDSLVQPGDVYVPTFFETSVKCVTVLDFDESATYTFVVWHDGTCDVLNWPKQYKFREFWKHYELMESR